MELKPCPFCGGEAEPQRQFGKYGPFVFVQCLVCKAQTRIQKARQLEEFDDDDEFWNQSAAYAVQRLWNTRAPATPFDDDSGDLPF